MLSVRGEAHLIAGAIAEIIRKLDIPVGLVLAAISHNMVEDALAAKTEGEPEDPMLMSEEVQ